VSELEVRCPYCDGSAELVDSELVYWKSFGMIWICQPCHAWVGTHKDSKVHKPLGTLANKELREARKAAHAALDPCWKDLAEQGHHKGKSRTLVYRRLAKALGIETKSCHIAWFDVKRCAEVVTVCANWKKATPGGAAQKSWPLPG